MPKPWSPTLLLLLLIPIFCQAQTDQIEWSESYTLKKEDFKATAPNTGDVQSIYPYCGVGYRALNFQLLFSNLNPVVSNSFYPDASWIDEGNDTEVLLRYAQTSWDINELAARKLRQKMHENRKRLGMATIERYLQQIVAHNTKIMSQYSKESKFARDSIMQQKWEQKVDSLLLVYAAYCQDCKKPKRVKTKKTR